jgi:hypothetical protein
MKRTIIHPSANMKINTNKEKRGTIGVDSPEQSTVVDISANMGHSRES